MGSGALTQAQADRTVEADVVNDAKGYLKLVLDHESLENTEYASYQNGQLTLRFDEQADQSNSGFAGEGEGLNPDTVFIFDNVFQIQNATGDDLKVAIDKSGLDNQDAFTFYAYHTNGNLIGDRTSDWNGQVNAEFGVNIGIRIETPNDLADGWESGEIVVTTTDESDENV
ncbi:MAG: DUF1102 domain-containing protein [archaeon]